MKLIVMRHGECEGLDKNIINGWADYELTQNGIEEAKKAAKEIESKYGKVNIDLAYTSYLCRTYDTAKNLLKGFGKICVINQDIRLNERHYGFFQGMKRQDAYKYEEYNTLSNSADRLDNRLIPITEELFELQLEEYSRKLNLDKESLRSALPKSESIHDVEKRLNEFLKEKIFIPENIDKTILIVGHANTVKLIVKYIDKLSFEEVTKLKFATCGMRIYDISYTENEIIVTGITNINKEWKM
ncbi:MAG: 2,3-bisphosphoglycerate-dependent phosphoglycerate mutase [Clostridia bacterium]|nr:2,3-bisphosphoglycerate-dependent phosphoglycerate mutase [Clostridia bacterium]